MKKLLKFSKPGCVPCVVVSNILKELALDVEVVEVDIKEYPEAIELYGLSGVPVLVLKENDEEVGRLNGLVTADDILKMIGEE